MRLLSLIRDRSSTDPRFTVYCEHCKETHYVDECKFVNVEEDFQGYDVLTAECPKTGKTIKGHVSQGW